MQNNEVCFFDADGNPISYEVLLKLSLGTTKTEKRETVSVENTKSTEIAVPNNKKIRLIQHLKKSYCMH
jgi:hypothetical protein